MPRHTDGLAFVKIERGSDRAGSPWNALPRKPAIADATQSVYVEAVCDFLKNRGIADPKVRITRILRVDLEGDGEEEVLISATNYFTDDKSDQSAAPLPEAPIESLRGVEVIPSSFCDAWSTAKFKRNF